MERSETDSIQTARSENPYASPQVDCSTKIEPAVLRLRSVASVFKMIGWLGIFLGALVFSVFLLSFFLFVVDPNARTPSLSMLVVSSTIFVLGIFYVKTGRRILKRDWTVRGRALFLSCVMMIGFPIFTIVGVICYRNIKRDFHEDDLTSADPTSGGDAPNADLA